MTEKKEPVIVTEKYTNEGTSPSISSIPAIDAKHAESDIALLTEIGYKQELRRKFSSIEVFGISFSIMGLLPSIASTFAIGITGGPVTFLWGWFIGGFFILSIGTCMAELASAIPTSGGLYYWTYHYAPKGCKKILSFWIGCSNTLALASAVCSITYGFSQEALATAAIATDGRFGITPPRTYAVFCGTIVVLMIIASFSTSVIAKIQTLSIVSNNVAIVLLFIVLPIGAHQKQTLTSSKFIFTHFENSSDWDDGWAFFIFGLMPAVWTICAFDACVHMSEEARHASKSVPFGIVTSISACWILGFIIIIILLLCMGNDVDSVLNSDFGQPFAQIVFNALGKKWAIALMVVISFCQFLMATSILTSFSRQIWAFSRDDGLPFSKFIKVVSVRWSIPLRAVWFGGALALVLGLLTLINTTAANALFSLTVAGNYLSWCTPMFLRQTWGRKNFSPGPFYLGPYFSAIVNWTAVVFQIFVIIIVMFPSSRENVISSTMNYATVIGPTVWILSVVYYFFWKKKVFVGPKSNIVSEE